MQYSKKPFVAVCISAGIAETRGYCGDATAHGKVRTLTCAVTWYVTWQRTIRVTHPSQVTALVPAMKILKPLKLNKQRMKKIVCLFGFVSFRLVSSQEKKFQTYIYLLRLLLLLRTIYTSIHHHHTIVVIYNNFCNHTHTPPPPNNE